MAVLTAEQIAGIVKYHGATAGGSFSDALYKPDTDGPIFVALALTESSGDTQAVSKTNSNGTHDYGLWQINDVHADLLKSGTWSNPNDNFHMAVVLYQSKNGKFTDWSSYNSGVYAANLAKATVAWSNPDTSQAQTNSVSDAANNTVAAATSVADFISAITKSSTWVRIGMGAAGVLLMIIVVAAMMKTHLPGPLGMVTRAAKSAKAAQAVTEGIPA